MPKRRVRDVGGPSPAAARVERCVNVTNSLMVRPNGSSAPATAQQRGFQLPLLLKLFCNKPCGHTSSWTCPACCWGNRDRTGSW